MNTFTFHLVQIHNGKFFWIWFFYYIQKLTKKTYRYVVTIVNSYKGYVFLVKI